MKGPIIDTEKYVGYTACAMKCSVEAISLEKKDGPTY